MTCIEIVINTITNSCFMRLPPFLFYTFIIPFFTLTKANIVKLIKSGGKPILLGFSCWMAITVVCLSMQALLGLF